MAGIFAGTATVLLPVALLWALTRRLPKPRHRRPWSTLHDRQIVEVVIRIDTSGFRQAMIRLNDALAQFATAVGRGSDAT
jgi:hypothetical protein